MSSIKRVVYSEYAVPHDAEGDARVYGRFTSCTLLGHPCAIVTEPIRDGDDRCFDALGYGGVFLRGGIAIHVSGKDDYGDKTGPGRIRALALYHVEFSPPIDHMAGLGVNGSEAACIVTSDPHHYRSSCRRRATRYPAGSHGREWQHHSHFGGCTGYFTLTGLAMAVPTGVEFATHEVLHAADERLGRRSPMLLNDNPHLGAMRRLCENGVDLMNNGGLGVVLRRHGRWSYRWENKR